MILSQENLPLTYNLALRRNVDFYFVLLLLFVIKLTHNLSNFLRCFQHYISFNIFFLTFSYILYYKFERKGCACL